VDSTNIEELLRTLSCDNQGEKTLLCETHISWVILCGDFAYKIKKPVSFGFLDFSTLELRRHFCEEELRLNRRFSSELYLAVVPISREEHGLAIDGPGPPIDYAVKMCRFQQEQLLDGIAACDGLDETLLRALAMELADIHARLPPCYPDTEGSEPGTPAALREAMEQNFGQVRNFPIPQAQLLQLQAIEAWSRRRYGELLSLMTQRVNEGAVIDGHGDAHLGNIALVDGAVRLFDCIEFNAAYRIMDSISEVAFLSMDMDVRGYQRASHRLLTDYLEYSGDYAGLPLLGIYSCYFAMVRAKVSLLRESKHEKALISTDGYSDFLRYLALAQKCTHPQRLFLAIMHGVSGSGKSTIAGSVLESSGAVRIRSDVERKRLAGMVPEQRSEPQQQDSLYSAAMTRRTFARLEALAAMTIEAGYPVIIDATFLHSKVRTTFRTLAAKLSVPFVIIDCVAEPDELRRRLIERERLARDASEADVSVLEKQLATVEALSHEEQAYRLEVELADDAALLWQRLQQQCFGRDN
jgi:aminoglycoside phosphotransferase family enzyme/predicted kinase